MHLNFNLFSRDKGTTFFLIEQEKYTFWAFFSLEDAAKPLQFRV